MRGIRSVVASAALAAAAGALTFGLWRALGLPPLGLSTDAPYPGLWRGFFALVPPMLFPAFTGVYALLARVAPPAAAPAVADGARWDRWSHLALLLLPGWLVVWRAGPGWRLWLGAHLRHGPVRQDPSPRRDALPGGLRPGDARRRRTGPAEGGGVPGRGGAPSVRGPRALRHHGGVHRRGRAALPHERAQPPGRPRPRSCEQHAPGRRDRLLLGSRPALGGAEPGTRVSGAAATRLRRGARPAAALPARRPTGRDAARGPLHRPGGDGGLSTVPGPRVLAPGQLLGVDDPGPDAALPGRVGTRLPRGAGAPRKPRGSVGDPVDPPAALGLRHRRGEYRRAPLLAQGALHTRWPSGSCCGPRSASPAAPGGRSCGRRPASPSSPRW